MSEEGDSGEMENPKFVLGDIILEIKSRHQGVILRKNTLEIILRSDKIIFDFDKIQSIVPTKGSDGFFTDSPAKIRLKGEPRGDKWTAKNWEFNFHHTQNDDINKFVDTFYKVQKPYHQRKAKERESALDYDSAIRIWEELGEIEEAARVRKLKADQGAVKVDQTVVHGDYVDDRDTIVKDSVVNKSKIGAGGKSKAEDLREAKSLFEEGLIDESEYKQMKKEILGK